MYSVNKAAMKLVQKMMDEPDRFKIGIAQDSNGVNLLDLGVNKPGGWLAGKYLTKILCGGLAEVSFGRFDLKGTPLSTVDVVVDQPELAIIGCQLSAWLVAKSEKFSPVASGPARSIAKDDRFVQSIDYTDTHDEAVIGLQTMKIPGPELTRKMVKKLKIKPHDFYVLMAPSKSIAGTIQVLGRTVEQSIHKLTEINYDISKVEYGFGSAPVPPLIDDEVKAMGRINDCLIYGSTQHLTIKDQDDFILDIMPKMISTRSKLYGRFFEDIYKDAGYSFYNLDFSIDAGAKVSITNKNTGKTFNAGGINYEILEKSLLKHHNPS